MTTPSTDIHEEDRVDWRFSFTDGIKVATGEGVARRVPSELSALGVERPLVVVDPDVMDAGVADPVFDALDESATDYVVFDEVEPNPRDATVEAGRARIGDESLDGLVAVGGGSTTDAAKAIGLLATNGGDVTEYGGIDRFEASSLPVVSVPTTVGTGSAISQGMVVTDTDTDTKVTMIDDSVSSDVALFDPTLLRTLPGEVLAGTGMDALAQAIECYVSARANPVSETLSRRAVEVIAENLRPAVAGASFDARKEMQTASVMQALAFTNAGLGLAHGMSNTVGGYFDTDHGVTTAVLLPHVLEFNLVACPEKYAALAAAMGRNVDDLSTREAADELIAAVERLADDIGIPDGLRSLGVAADAVPEMAADAVDHVDSRANPRDYSESDVVELYERAL